MGPHVTMVTQLIVRWRWRMLSAKESGRYGLTKLAGNHLTLEQLNEWWVQNFDLSVVA